jgi:hypothetical protein
VKNNLKYFHGSILFTLIGLATGFAVGYVYSDSWSGAFSALFLTSILAVLEISLSFDNAVVNASILREMSPTWRHRFITWGILVAVFGMRIVFPLAIVSLAAGVSPWGALVLATTRPREYAQIMLDSHVAVAGFGGAFLMMVALGYFFNQHKTDHWLQTLERWLVQAGRIEAAEIGVCLLFFFAISHLMPEASERLTFLSAGIAGMVTYIAVEGLTVFLKVPDAGRVHIEKASAAMFLYLEVLDASFSFDGVVGAFALTSNLFIIAAGLGIGAMFVRSLTILLVEKRTLEHFRYLEHGAFYAIGALATMMLLDVFIHVPEVITGLIGGIIIVLSLIASVRENRAAAG